MGEKLGDSRVSGAATAHKRDFARLPLPSADSFEGWALLEGDALRIHNLSETLCRIYGRPMEELLSLPSWVEVVLPEDRNRLRDRVLGEAAKGSEQFEITIVRGDGHTRRVTVSLERLAAEGGNRYLARVRDIGDTDSLEAGLHLSDERFRSLSECCPVGIFFTDPKGSCLYANPRTREIGGFTYEEAVGMGWLNTIHPSERAAVQAELENCVREARPGKFVVQLVISGESRWVLARTAPMFSGDGALAGFAGTIEDITESRRIELELREARDDSERKVRERTHELELAKERFEIIAQTTSDFLWEWDLLTGKLEPLSRAGIFGRYADEAAQREIAWWKNGIHPADRGRVCRSVCEAIERGADRWEQEYRFLRADGGFGYYRSKGAILRDPSGKALRVLGATIDRTSTMQRERLRARLESIVECSRDAIFAADMEGNVQSWNSASERIYGYSREEILGRSGRILCPPELQDEFTSLLHRLAGGESIDAYETIRLRKNGQRFHASVSFAPLRDPMGQIIGVSAIVRDISRRKEVELSLSRQREEERELLDMMPAIIVQKDRNNRFVRVNSSAAAFFGRPPAELEGKTVEEIFPEKAAEFYADDLEVMATGEAKRGLIQSLRNSAGEEHWFHTDNVPYRNERGQIVGVLILAVDVTERRRTEERMRQLTQELGRSNADLEQFAQIVSHDLREPLRMVSSFVSLLGRKYAGRLDPDADEFIAFAVEGAQRARRLVESVLSYSRAATGQVRLKPVGLSSLLDDVLENLKLDLDASGAMVTSSPLPMVNGDAVQLGQLLQNLLSNAIKFGREKPPRIHLSSERYADGWRISVRDNGTGINKEYSDRIFRLYPRPPQAFDTPATGLGLAICRKIVERHGGTIWAESEEGVGSVFHFTLPDTVPDLHPE